MKRKLFSELSAPPIVAMIQCRTKEECIAKIRRSDEIGGEAFGVQLCKLKYEERTEEKLSEIFAACGEKPIYITSYKADLSESFSDEECMDLLLSGLKCGANLADIPADIYDKNDRQLTFDTAAVEKQRRLIDKIHADGKEVLMSTHDFRDLSGDEIFEIAKAQAARNADVLKIVVTSKDIARLPEYIGAIQRVNREIKKPFLLLDGGPCSDILRKTGGILGCCMYLCVESHSEIDTPSQPLIRKLKLIRENLSEEK